MSTDPFSPGHRSFSYKAKIVQYSTSKIISSLNKMENYAT